MTKLDQFESVFKSADKAVYTYDRPTFDHVLLVTDLNEADAADIASRVRSFLAAVDEAGTRWDTLWPGMLSAAFSWCGGVAGGH